MTDFWLVSTQFRVRSEVSLRGIEVRPPVAKSAWQKTALSVAQAAAGARFPQSALRCKLRRQHRMAETRQHIMAETAAALSARIAEPRENWSLPTDHAHTCSLAAFEPEMIVAGCRDGFLRFYTLGVTPPRMTTKHALQSTPVCLAVALPSLFVSTGSSTIMRLHMSSDGVAAGNAVDGLPEELRGHSHGAVTALAAGNGLLYSAGNDFTIRSWDATLCVALGQIASGVSPITGLSVLGGAHDDLLLSVSNAGAGCISVWRLPATLSHAKGLRSWCTSPLLQAFLGGTAGGSDAKSSDVSALECLHSFCTDQNQVNCAQLAVGAIAALSCSLSGEVQVWDLAKLRLTSDHSFRTFGHDQALCAMVLVGDAVVTASNDRTLRVTRCLAPSASSPRGVHGNGDQLSGLESTADGVQGGMHAAAAATGDAEAVLKGVEEAAEALAREAPLE